MTTFAPVQNMNANLALSNEELRKIDAYWRAANYRSLLRER